MISSINRIDIAFLTTGDPTSRRSWSGIDYHMAHALQTHCGEVHYPGPIEPAFRYSIGRAANKVSSLLLGRKYAYLNSFLLSKGYAAKVSEWLSGRNIDLIFVPSASPVAAFLNTRIPIVYLSGATFSLMHSYYPQFTNLLPLSVKEGNAIEQSMIDRAKLLLYPTEWPAKSAITDYHADKSKIHVVPYGANLEAEDVPPREKVFNRKRADTCRLLFIGVDWQRKGGSIAFDTLVEMKKLGIETELTVCGCVPPKECSHEGLRVVPFLDKNDPDQRRRMNELLLESDFLLVPTRSECFGVVFCEASAFGLPSISTDTGGVPGVVAEGENGHLLPIDAVGKDYARLIAEIHADEHRYNMLVRSSRKTFEERLNWDAWGRVVGKLLHDVAGGTNSRSTTRLDQM